ncbi:hypothetical protein TI39_contig607g00018 [Zymoseptoria brevis]|uniref:Carboxylic ester hydrolase n=1 Tax=Zymoseptoria brevis TaxID=1047168 RepID=A0A0F4GHZ9_9PEZI|nr:hypothetical protein TI39_contig607g00018 [Zymoseptoria brevis]
MVLRSEIWIGKACPSRGRAKMSFSPQGWPCLAGSGVKSRDQVAVRRPGLSSHVFTAVDVRGLFLQHGSSISHVLPSARLGSHTFPLIGRADTYIKDTVEAPCLVVHTPRLFASTYSTSIMAVPPIQLYTHQHPRLGQIEGIVRGSDVVQFRGIPFADIPARFRQSVLRTELPKQPLDATQPGPFCPQPTSLPFPPFWTGPIPADHPTLPSTTYDEWKCLNLNVSAPASILASTKPVPVLVYIHGGAFISGGNGIQVTGREISDPTNLIRRMVARGKPLVVVNINYRLGPFGFLASKELTSFNKSHGEAEGNYGLHDQRTALKWVSKFIAGFGGDPENVTIAGGSAGGASCHWQAIFAERKFKRAILSSGTALALGALPLDRHQKIFDTIAEKVGHNVEGVQSLPPDDLVAMSSGAHHPYIDGEWIQSGGFQTHQNVHDMPDLMIGWTTFEEDLTYAVLGSRQPYTDSGMRGVLEDFFSTSGIISGSDALFQPGVLKAYNLENARIELRSEDLQSCAELAADVIFKIPPILIATRHEHGKIFVWNLQATNPHSGWPLGYRKAHHALADLLVFNVAGDLVPPEHREEYDPPVEQLQEDWTDFCYGELKWDEFVAGSEQLGPVYTYENFGRGGRRATLGEAIGENTLARWREVLEVCT